MYKWFLTARGDTETFIVGSSTLLMSLRDQQKTHNFVARCEEVGMCAEDNQFPSSSSRKWCDLLSNTKHCEGKNLNQH